jgi:hypothetical protein
MICARVLDIHLYRFYGRTIIKFTVEIQRGEDLFFKVQSWAKLSQATSFDFVFHEYIWLCWFSLVRKIILIQEDRYLPIPSGSLSPWDTLGYFGVWWDIEGCLSIFRISLLDISSGLRR